MSVQLKTWSTLITASLLGMTLIISSCRSNVEPDTNKDKLLSEKMVGYWTLDEKRDPYGYLGFLHYQPDGTVHVQLYSRDCAEMVADIHANWRVTNGQLISIPPEGAEIIDDIILLTDDELVLREVGEDVYQYRIKGTTCVDS